MTTKPKSRKSSAKPKREARKLEVLIARWKWLKADQDYQTAMAPLERDTNRRHHAEQERIIAKLRTLVPQDYYELKRLYGFVIDGIKVGGSLRSDDADLDMLVNIFEAFASVFGHEREDARKEGMKNMREFLNKRTGAVFDDISPSVLQQIEYGNV